MKRNMSFADSARRWVSVHLNVTEFLSSLGTEYEVVRYRQFVEEPIPTLNRLYSLAGFSPISRLLDVTSSGVHVIEGNPRRFDVRITQYDDSWKRILSRKERFFVAFLAPICIDPLRRVAASLYRNVPL